MSEIKISITFAWLGEQNREDQRNNHKQVSHGNSYKKHTDIGRDGGRYVFGKFGSKGKFSQYGR